MGEKYQKLTRDNVEEGDLLVAGMHFGISVLQIDKIDERGIMGTDRDGTIAKRSYGRAVVLKKDGSYLIGEELIPDEDR